VFSVLNSPPILHTTPQSCNKFSHFRLTLLPSLIGLDVQEILPPGTFPATGTTIPQRTMNATSWRWNQRTLPSAPANGWLQSAVRGVCGQTALHEPGDCARGASGSLVEPDVKFGFEGSKANDPAFHLARNMTRLVAVCLSACARCAGCSFISVSSSQRNECSWFRECSLDLLDARSTNASFFSGRAVPSAQPNGPIGGLLLHGPG